MIAIERKKKKKKNQGYQHTLGVLYAANQKKMKLKMKK